MNKNAITFQQLTARLERAIHCPVGERGLNILIYGWIAKYGRVTRGILASRRYNDDDYWLTADEAYFFSLYAGYDLTHD